jgi:hypothetical protein
LADTLIQNCIVYQRFLHNQDRSIRYFVKQNTIGIVMEDEVIESTPVLRRTLRSWWVQNIQ